MKNYIENPIEQHNWDPSKGDYVSEPLIKEDKLFHQRKKRKNMFIAFLTFVHVAFLFIMFLFY